MPTETFYKLKDVKRKGFINEAYKEFALNSFEAASITNLVKSFGIAKGSVYQYFKDKEDLYQYLVEEANSQLNSLLDRACPNNDDDFFSWYRNLLLVEVKFFLSFPANAAIFQKVQNGINQQDKQLAEILNQDRLKRIRKQLSDNSHDSIIESLLTNSSLMIFNLLTGDLPLPELIIAGDPIYLDHKELVSLCSEWVTKLKDGL